MSASTVDPKEEIRHEYEARYGRVIRETVEAGRVRDFLCAMDEPGITPGQAVPALFLLTMGRTRRPQPARGSAVNAGDDFEFVQPVFVGDVIAIERRVVAVEERQGKQGQMYLTRAEATYTNQHGTVVARSKQNTLRWGW